MSKPGNQSRNFRNEWKQMKKKIQWYKPLVSKKNGHKREVYSNTYLPQEARKRSNKQPNFTPKGARRQTTNESSQRKEVI